MRCLSTIKSTTNDFEVDLWWVLQGIRFQTKMSDAESISLKENVMIKLIIKILISIWRVHITWNVSIWMRMHSHPMSQEQILDMKDSSWFAKFLRISRLWRLRGKSNPKYYGWGCHNYILIVITVMLNNRFENKWIKVFQTFVWWSHSVPVWTIMNLMSLKFLDTDLMPDKSFWIIHFMNFVIIYLNATA